MFFVDPVPFYLKYDQFFTVASDLNGVERKLLADRVVEISKKGLGSRIISLEWTTTNESKVLTFGILINPETYDNALEKGPSADSPAAADFRSFWGEKSEMRKFADTSILEAVVWQSENQSKKRSIVSQIVKFILQRHLNIHPNRVKFIVDPFDSVLSAPFLKGTGEEEYFSLLETYDRVSQSIRLLDGLPLAVVRVFSPEPALRQTEILPVLPITPAIDKSVVYKHDEWTVPRPSAFVSPPWCPSLEIQITLETSGKWPDEVKAIGRLKTAFYIKIADLLKQQFQFFSTSREDCALVFHNGYVFRLIIVYSREVILLKTQISDRGVVKTKQNDASSALDKLINHRPKLCTFLNGISHQYPSFSLTCRLLKRWISSHLLSGYISDEALELIVCHVYLSPKPFTEPGSSSAGFLRSLTVLATFDWLKNPLIVNLNNQLSKQEINEIRTEFIKLRPTLPPMCIATPDDRLGILWTRPQPNAMIVERLTNLAQSSLAVLEKQLLSTRLNFDPKIVFRSPLDVYDVLIHLFERHVPRRYMSFDERTEFFPSSTHSKKEQRKNASKETPFLPVFDYDPVEFFIEELKALCDGSVMVFYNQCGGCVVGLLWNPQSLNDETSTENGKKLSNRERILQNIEIIGKGLLKNIDVKS